MAVIPFPNLAPQGPNPSMSWELRSLTARNPSPLNGVATTLERPGSHWAARLPYENLAEERRASLQTFAVSCRGHASRFYMPVFGWTRRGSFSAPELLTNNTFASGTTGWASGSQYDLTASDGVLRATRNAVTSSQSLAVQSPTLTQYVPYVVRCILHAGRGTYSQVGAYFSGTSAFSVSTPGNSTSVYVPSATGAQLLGVLDLASSALIAGDYVEMSYISASRCALVDNGPNYLVRSDDLSNASWTKSGTTVTVDYYTAPDGTATADRLIEDTSTAEHYALQSATRTSAVAEWSFAVALRRGDVGNLRDRAQLRISSGTGGHTIGAIFDLTAGTISTAASATGSAANPRAFIASAGNGYYYCCVVGQIPASDTTVQGIINLVQNPSTTNYTGSASQNIGVWRATLAQSSLPTRLVQTVATAATAGTLQTGSALHLKGLPASTNGLLLQGDPVEIITNTSSQLVRVRAPLNSDAAGLGYLQFEAPIRISPLDNAAVIICNPLCRMMLDSNVAGWTDRAAGFSDLEFTAVEDTFP